MSVNSNRFAALSTEEDEEMQQEGSVTEGWGDNFWWTSTSSVEQGDSPTQDEKLKVCPKRKRWPVKIKRTPKSTVGSSGLE
jgi:hypothetical protein